MKFFQNRAVAWVVLVLAIVGSCLLGLAKKPASVPKVTYYNWICDDAKLLDTQTEKTIEQYNASWDGKYRAVIAVASVNSIRGWTYEKFCAQLGGDWGLGPNDMLLLLVKGDHYYVACGDNVLDANQRLGFESKLQSAIEPYYYKGDYDGAVTAFFRQADVVYGQMNSVGALQNDDNNDTWPEKNYSSGINVGGIILLLIAIFVVWMLLDRVRYNRYQRRSANTTYVVNRPRTVYYPIFWGRQRATPPPPQPYQAPPRPVTHQAPHQNTTYRSNPPRPSAPRQTTTHTTTHTSAPRSSAPRSGGSSSGFSGRGFGGGKHR